MVEISIWFLPIPYFSIAPTFCFADYCVSNQHPPLGAYTGTPNQMAKMAGTEQPLLDQAIEDAEEEDLHSDDDYDLKLTVVKVPWEEDRSLNPRFTFYVELPSGHTEKDIDAIVVDDGSAFKITVTWSKVFTHPTSLAKAFGQRSPEFKKACLATGMALRPHPATDTIQSTFTMELPFQVEEQAYNAPGNPGIQFRNITLPDDRKAHIMQIILIGVARKNYREWTQVAPTGTVNFDDLYNDDEDEDGGNGNNDGPRGGSGGWVDAKGFLHRKKPTTPAPRNSSIMDVDDAHHPHKKQRTNFQHNAATTALFMTLLAVVTVGGGAAAYVKQLF
jgi:hypothetical protein